MKNLKYLMFILFAVFSCSNENKEETFDYGRVENGIYLNDFFDFSITLPDGWVVLTREQTENLMNTGKQMIAGDDETLARALKVSEINTANLMAVFQYELGSPVEYNPNIMIVAENVNHAPGIKNGSDYLYQTRRLLEQTQFEYDFLSEDFEKVMIGGSEFYKMYSQMNYMGLNIGQIYYATIKKDFSLSIIISFISDAQKEALLEAVNSISI